MDFEIRNKAGAIIRTIKVDNDDMKSIISAKSDIQWRTISIIGNQNPMVEYEANGIELKDDMHVALISDDNYAICTAVAMLSTVEHTESFINFHVIGVDLSEENKAMIVNALKNYKCIINFIDASGYMDKIQKFRINNTSHIKKPCYLKLLLHELLPAEVEKVVYIDGDTLVLEDLAELYSTNLEDNMIAATYNEHGDGGVIRLGLSGPNTFYFNSGIILANLKAWREENIFEKFSEWYDNNVQRMALHDQEILNGVFAGRALLMEQKWNISHWELFRYKKELTDKLERKFICSLPKGVVHFTGPFKPWLDIYNKRPRLRDDQYRLVKGLYDTYIDQALTKELQPSLIPGPINVMGVTNEDYMIPYATTFHSLLSNATTSVDLYLLCFDVSAKSKEKLIKSLSKFKKKHTLTFIDATDEMKSIVNKFKDVSNYHWSNIAWGKLLIPEIMKDKNAVLYVDGDVMFNADVAELWSTDLNGYFIAATKNSKGKKRAEELGMRPGMDYFNSGVMLFNIPFFIGTDFNTRCISWCSNNMALVIGDQDVLNGVINGLWNDIGAKWNMPYNSGYRVDDESKSNAKIIHFLTKEKPWNGGYHDCDDKYISQYRKYFKTVKARWENNEQT